MSQVSKKLLILAIVSVTVVRKKNLKVDQKLHFLNYQLEFDFELWKV